MILFKDTTKYKNAYLIQEISEKKRCAMYVSQLISPKTFYPIELDIAFYTYHLQLHVLINVKLLRFSHPEVASQTIL